MDNNIKSYIKTNVFLGKTFLVDEKIGELYCPKISEVNELFLYNHYLNTFVDLYEDDKKIFFSKIISSEKLINEFMMLISYFKPKTQISFIKNIFFIEGTIENKNISTNYIDKNNFNIFMDSLKVMHYLDKDTDNYKPANKIAQEMLERAKKLKKEIQEKVKKKDGIGFLEIMSSVCARHNSINPLNINQLNYFQILEQYYRLLKVDNYEINMMAMTNGTLSEQGSKKIKHYSTPIKNE